MAPIRTVKRGEILNPNARFPIEFKGDWSSVLQTNTIDIMADYDTTAINTTGYTDYDNVKVQWSEGPLWSEEDNCFYCSDPTHGIIFRLDTNEDDESKNKLRIWAIHSGGIDPKSVPNLAETGSNGMTYDAYDKSKVYICQHYNHAIVSCNLSQHTAGKTLHEAPGYKILSSADKNNKIFNSPNDIVTYKKDGSIWFTDPIYGFLTKDKLCDEWQDNESYLDNKCAGEKRTGIKGVYRYDINTKEVRLMIPFHRRPNGLAFSYGKDQDVLWVADSVIGCPSWTCYPIPNKLSNDEGESFLTATKVITSAMLGTILGSSSNKALLGHEGLSDGFKIDALGRLWTSIPNGFAVIDVRSDVPKVLCQILLGVNTSNVTVGDGGEVWFTGAGGIWRVQQREFVSIK